ADIQLLRGIRHLLQTAGYTIKGVQKILREGGVEDVKKIGSSQDAGSEAKGRARPSHVPVVAVDGPRQFSAAEISALRAIAAELDTGGTMLRAGNAQHTSHAARPPKRAATRS